MGAGFGYNGNFRRLVRPAYAVLCLVQVLFIDACGHAHGQFVGRLEQQTAADHAGQIGRFKADFAQVRAVRSHIFVISVDLRGEVQTGQAFAAREGEADFRRVGHEAGKVAVVKGIVSDFFQMLSEIQVVQRAGAVEGIAADLAYAVDEDQVVQAAAEHERGAAGGLQRRVAHHGFQLLAIAEQIVAQGFDRFGNDHAAQAYPVGAVGGRFGVGIVPAGFKGVAVDGRDGHAVDFTRNDHVHVGSGVGGDRAGGRVKFEIRRVRCFERHLHERAGLAHAHERIIPRTVKRRVGLRKLLIRHIGGEADLRVDRFAVDQERAIRNQRGVAENGQLLETRQPVKRALADGGYGVGNGQFFQLRAVGKGARADGGYGVEQIHDPQSAVHERFRADGGEIVGVGNGKDLERLTALEHAVRDADGLHRIAGAPGANA